ncbi:hypothetical protein [Nocardia cyriacigeorgica]|uniref:PD-(D/E)XK nuclease domain-containing protein n=1 Tax=Nocardia cyriacigeorgica TaxID=135487 RepID=UPI00189347C6|nr:hypothetical protein [Nocardia cyriacigeorgica]MBF6439273.1 hypothetical protein [Nocardia cyriacigeorgica]
MPRWTKESALTRLMELHARATELEGAAETDEEFVTWRLQTIRAISQICGEASLYYYHLTHVRWNARHGHIGGPARRHESFDPSLGLRRLEREEVTKGLQATRGILAAAIDELRESDLEEFHKSKNTAPEASTIIKIVNLAEGALRRTMREIPKDETEVQNRFEDLLHGAQIQFHREKERVTYSSRTYIPDFTVASADLAIELKFSNKPGREAKIIAEINDDIMAYGTRWGNMLFVIYDVGTIRDVSLFSKQFEKRNILVRVVKH